MNNELDTAVKTLVDLITKDLTGKINLICEHAVTAYLESSDCKYLIKDAISEKVTELVDDAVSDISLSISID
jgi:hypothetical protein